MGADRGDALSHGEDQTERLDAAVKLATAILEPAFTSGTADMYAEAEEMQRKLLEIQTRMLGADHADTLLTISLVGVCLSGQGKYAEAAVLQQEVLAKQRATLGPQHAEIQATMSLLALIPARPLDWPRRLPRESALTLFGLLKSPRRTSTSSPARTVTVLMPCSSGSSDSSRARIRLRLTCKAALPLVRRCLPGCLLTILITSHYLLGSGGYARPPLRCLSTYRGRN